LIDGLVTRMSKMNGGVFGKNFHSILAIS
jgi:hypothetical protein